MWFVCMNLCALNSYAQVEQSAPQEGLSVGTQEEAQGATQGLPTGIQPGISSNIPDGLSTGVQPGLPSNSPVGFSTGVKPGLPSDAQPAFPGHMPADQRSSGFASQPDNGLLMRQIGYRLLGSLFEPFESAYPEPVAPSETAYAESPMLSAMLGLPQYPYTSSYTSPYTGPGAERPEYSFIESLMLRSLLMEQLPQFGNRHTSMSFQGMLFCALALYSI